MTEPLVKCVDKDSIEVMRINPDGEIYWRGRLVETDGQFVDAMLELKAALVCDAKTADQQELADLRRALGANRVGDPNFVQIPQTLEQAQAMILLADRWIRARLANNMSVQTEEAGLQ